MKAWIILIIFFAREYECSKILGVFPMTSHSHFKIGYSLMKELADRGHDVTMLSPYPQKTASKNYRDIGIPEIIEPVTAHFKETLLELNSYTAFQSIDFIYSIGYGVVDATLNHTKVKNLLASDEKFDLIIIEQFLDEALMYIPYYFKAPVIWVSSIGSGGFSNDLVKNPAPISHVPSYFLSYTGRMSFMERVHNTLVVLYEEYHRKYVALPTQNKILHKYYPNAPEIDELLEQTSLILLNSHLSSNEPKPHVPNMIEIGGYHVKTSGKLPKDLQEFLDNAEEGVIYFSMGSNLKTSEFPIEKQRVFLNTFAKLKQKVLWKFELDTIPGLPKNVKLVKWAPQTDVLAHKNVKAFISHGGLLSSIEAVYFGVPIVGIPIYGDQKMNMARSISSGMAVSVPFPELTEESLSRGLDEILNNPEYLKNAKLRSNLMNDRIVKPIDEAVYWVEYAIRYPGCKHLKSSGMSLNWLQYNLIDVLGFFIGIMLAVLLIIYLIIKLINRMYIPNRYSARKVNKAKTN